jgi:hypothetical protein
MTDPGLLICEGRALTDDPSRFLKQLCRHFSHSKEAEWTEDRGSIRFAYGLCDLQSGQGELFFTASSEAQESLDRLTSVISAHLDRFTFREPISIEWAQH